MIFKFSESERTRLEDALEKANTDEAPKSSQQSEVGSTDGFGGQPSREELISVIAALIEPRMGSDKKAQLARARQAARKVLARTQPPNEKAEPPLAARKNSTGETP